MPDTVPRNAYRPPPGTDDTTDQLAPVPATGQAPPENPRHARTRRLRAIAPGWGAWAVIAAIVGGLVFGIVATAAPVAGVGHHGPVTVKHQGAKPAPRTVPALVPRDSAPGWTAPARTRASAPARKRARPAVRATAAPRPAPSPAATTPPATTAPATPPPSTPPPSTPPPSTPAPATSVPATPAPATP